VKWEVAATDLEVTACCPVDFFYKWGDWSDPNGCGGNQTRVQVELPCAAIPGCFCSNRRELLEETGPQFPCTTTSTITSTSSTDTSATASSTTETVTTATSATATTATFTTATQTSTTATTVKAASRAMSTGATAGLGLVGGLVLLALIGIGAWFACFTHKELLSDATQRQVLAENTTQVLNVTDLFCFLFFVFCFLFFIFFLSFVVFVQLRGSFCFHYLLFFGVVFSSCFLCLIVFEKRLSLPLQSAC
jgi:hypothetical protein